MKCQTCGKQFQGRPKRKYCSRRCAALALRRTATKKCKTCGKTFSGRPNVVAKAQYCSRKCYGQAKRTTATKKCRQCGKVFSGKPAAIARRKYCSRQCYGAAVSRRVELKCCLCGKSFVVRGQDAKKRRFCSRGCGARGEKGPHTRNAEKYANITKAVLDGKSLSFVADDYSVSRQWIQMIVQRECRLGNPVLYGRLMPWAKMSVPMEVLREHKKGFLKALTRRGRGR